MNTNEGLVKVHIDLPNHWAIGGEALWATPLGDDLYKIENVPFYAYGLNFHDIVWATSNNKDQIPEIKKVVTPSGNRTFRLFFENELNREEQIKILDTLKNPELSFERNNSMCLSIDLEPDGDYQVTFDQLSAFEEKGIIGFETCEARVAGSFDDVQEDN
jgi:hypothetical protein